MKSEKFVFLPDFKYETKGEQKKLILKVHMQTELYLWSWLETWKLFLYLNWGLTKLCLSCILMKPTKFSGFKITVESVF